MKISQTNSSKYAEILPWCLCDKKWYRVLFSGNPLFVNKYYWLGWFDPESWLEWWHFGAPIRIYYWKRKRWIDFPGSNRRGEKMWDHAEAVKIEPPKGTMDDNLRRGSGTDEDL